MRATMDADVDVAGPGLTRIRLTGVLDRGCGPRLARLLDEQLDHCLEQSRPSRLIIDLSDLDAVCLDGLHALRHAQLVGHDADVTVSVVGLAIPLSELPDWAARMIQPPRSPS